MNNNIYDAIVIGGGMTGSYAAKNLCEAGLKTLLLERGPSRKHPESYSESSKDPWDYRYRGIIAENLKRQQPVQSNIFLYTDATAKSFVDDVKNPYSTTANKPFNWYRAYQLGGKSLQWGRQCYRWSDLDFAANKRDGIGIDWPLRYRDIAPFYEEVEKFVGISGQVEGLPQLPDGHYQPPMPMNDMEFAMRAIAATHWPERRITMGRVANLTKPHNDRGPCIYRDKCALGCPHGGYYSGLSGALPVASATGKLTVKCDAIVERIIYDKARRRAKSVRVLDANSGQDQEYSAPIIFVCAGTLNSTWLLLNSAEADGVGTASGELGHNLMDHHHMVASAVVIGGPKTFPQGRRPTRCYMPRYRNLNGGDEAGFRRGYAFELGAQREDWTKEFHSTAIGVELKARLSQWGAWRIIMVGYGEMLPDHSNRVSLDHLNRDAWGLPSLKIDAEFKANELEMNADMTASSLEMLEAFGGTESVIWQQMSKLGESIHEMGTARMGRDPATSVLDPFNRLWDAPNVYVTDGAAMASSACQNPSLTYMALTARAVGHAVAALRNNGGV